MPIKDMGENQKEKEKIIMEEVIEEMKQPEVIQPLPEEVIQKDVEITAGEEDKEPEAVVEPQPNTSKQNEENDEMLMRLDFEKKFEVPARDNPRVVGALSGDGTGRHFVASPVKKEKLSKNKKELEEEAAKVLHQADRIDCITAASGVPPEKFYSLPHRKKNKEQNFNSLRREGKRKGSLELIAPKKPPRTFATSSSPQGPQKTSIFDVFKKEKKAEPKKSNLKRSVSDASNLKSKTYGPDNQPLRKRSGSDTEDCVKSTKEKKQLTPIIEVNQREDYFQPGQENKENIRYNENLDVTSPERKKKKESVTEQLKKFIDEVDEELYKETGIRVTPPQEVRKNPEPIIIDLDKAQKISTKGKKFKDTSLGKKLKSITHKKNKTNDANKIKKLPAQKIKETKSVTKEKQPVIASPLSPSPAPIIKAAIENLENSNKISPTMLHSSQKPVEKLPLTKGRTVDPLVKRLSNDSSSSPPPTKTNILITPHGSIQHNNNQPFSYTRGLSPDKLNDSIPNPGSPIIYAQVVCGSGGNGPAKQTVHTAFTNGKRHPHSDSDEGLGGEENSGFSRLDKPITHFGDNNRNYFDEVDKYEEESPITPKFRNPAYINGYSNFETTKYNGFSKVEHMGYFDSSNRGRADGMDSKRRESLTEPQENGFGVKVNGRSDVSARRDLLESRINRRMNDHSLRTSPEYLKNSSPAANVYISEKTSKYYRSGSTSPVGFKEVYKSETKPDKYGKPHTTESRSKQYFGEAKDRLEYESRQKSNGYQYNGFDSEPKSFDSQISDYRSSPENRQLEASHRYNLRNENRTIFKDRDVYKSNPEIHVRSYQENRERNDSYHDSLRREKVESRVINSKYRSDRYLEENERKEKFVDSGIENDFRRDSGRDSGDNYRSARPINSRRDYLNESEDEGFASSLLIASERQHTEDSINHRRRDDKVRDYDSDKREDDRYRNLENFEYRSKFRSSDYAPRERSIDDGSHYDPRIDKDLERSTLKRVEKKPPKPEKKSSLEKVKSLFTRDTKKKKEKQQAGMVREESLRARYVEYKGKDIVEPRYKKKDANDLQAGYDYNARRRLSTPSPSPTRNGNLKSSGLQRNNKPTENGTHGSWFKSLDRLARKSTKKDDTTTVTCSGTEDDTPSKPTPSKNLRFFGDTDLESNDDSIRHKTKTRTGWNRSQSSSYLHDIGETGDLGKRKPSHKSMTNVAASESDRDIKSSRSTLKPPISPSHRIPRDVSRQDRERGRRRKNEVSSVESSTEGDSSQQSQRSIVYLHAATVGDIPGPGYLKNGRRAASREELVSNSSSRIQPQVKTLSRSFSVLAPWRPRHTRENMDIDYTQYPKPQKNGKYEQKTSKSSSRKDSSSTLKKKAQESKKNQSSSTLNRKSKSKENLSSSQTLKRSREEISKGSSSTLYKKKERLPRENSRYSRDKDDRKMATKSLSVESLGNNSRNGRKSRDEDRRDISRSVSMPRDPEKSAGWFKMAKKSKMTSSTQRL